MSRAQANGDLKNNSPKLPHNKIYPEDEPCIIHREKSYELYCATCDELVCTSCIVEKHSHHKFQAIKEVASSCRNRYQQLTGLVKEKHGLNLNAQIKKLDAMKRNCIFQTDKIIEDFRARQSRLCQDIEVATLQHISALQVRRQQAKQDIQTMEKELGEKRSVTSTLMTMCNYLIQDGSDVAVIRAKYKVENMFKELEQTIEIREIKPPKIIFMDVEEETIANLFGNLEIGDNENEINATVPRPLEQRNDEELGSLIFGSDHADDNLDISVDRVYSFDCQGKGGVLAVQPIDNGSALVTCYDSANKIYLTDVNDGQAKYSLSFPINDLAISRSGDVVVSSQHSQCIKKIHPNSKVENFINTSEVLPLGIHVNQNGDIFVCLVDQLNYIIEPSSIRRVVKFSEVGTQLEIFEYNGYRRLFTLPGSVSENANHDICVVDLLSDSTGGILTMDSHGQQKWIYSGQGKGHTFRPHSVCNDKYGHVIVSDISNNSVHLLNGHGKFLRILLCFTEGLYRPSAIAIDKSGYLWVGHIKKGANESSFIEEPLVQVFKYIQ